MPGSLAWFGRESLTGGVSHIALEHKVTTKVSKRCMKYGNTTFVDTNQVSLDLISFGSSHRKSCTAHYYYERYPQSTFHSEQALQNGTLYPIFPRTPATLPLSETWRRSLVI